MFESNPILTRSTEGRLTGGSVTFDGIIHRTGLLLLAAMAAFAISWTGIGGGLGIAPESMLGFSVVASLIAFVLGLFIAFTQSCNPYLIGTYALGQGFLLGTVSRLADIRFPGIAGETAGATFAVFLLVLGAYRIRVLRATPLLAKIVTVAFVTLFALFLWNMIGGLFGHPLSIIQGNGPGAILVSAAIVVLSAVTFVFDFARAEYAVAEGISEEYSWQISFGLLIGLVWLYLNILSLLTRLRSRD